MEHIDSSVVLLANGLTLIMLIAILVGNILWRKWHKELIINKTKNLEEGRSCEEKILRQDNEKKAKESKWRQADGNHVDLSLIVEELDSLCHVISSLEDTVKALESREDIRFSGILSSLQFINANSEQMASGRKDLYGKVSVPILQSNEYLQGYQHVVDILEPVCGVNGTTNRLTLTRDELLQKLRQVKIHNGLTEDELLQNFGEGMRQMENLVKELKMMLDELENLPPLEKIKVRNDNPEILSLMCSKSANLDSAYLSVAKRMQSWECKRDVSVTGVNFLCNFLGEATTWPRLHHSLDSSTNSYSL